MPQEHNGSSAASETYRDNSVKRTNSNVNEGIPAVRTKYISVGALEDAIGT
jgi:hypothetical protein